MGKNVAVVVALLAIGCGPPASRGNPGDDDGVDAPVGPTVDAPSCASATATATAVVRPVDILWVIDNSGSMDEEEARIQNNMNQFAASIASSGVDYRVVVINDTTHVNVPPPLGGSPQLLNVNVNIDSHNALEKTVTQYASYQSFLRPTSVKHIVVVSDDESDWSQSQFETQLGALASPGFGTGWKFHAVVAEDPPFNFSSHCFALSAAVGSTYINLKNAHNGQFFSLCDTNWSPLFTTLAQSVTQGLSLPCTYALPPPPSGQTIDPTKVNFIYTPSGGSAQTIANVGSAAGCNGGAGWYYNNPTTPTQIIACPATCTALEHDAGGSVDVQFGCSTIIQ
jgi:hypothetical protein